jgi:hypothetical protein
MRKDREEQSGANPPASLPRSGAPCSDTVEPMSDAEVLLALRRMAAADRRSAHMAAIRNTASFTESMRKSEPKRLLRRAAVLERARDIVATFTQSTETETKA